MELDDTATLQERLDFMAKHRAFGFMAIQLHGATKAVRQKLYARLGIELPGDHSWWPPEKD